MMSITVRKLEKKQTTRVVPGLDVWKESKPNCL